MKPLLRPKRRATAGVCGPLVSVYLGIMRLSSARLWAVAVPCLLAGSAAAAEAETSSLHLSSSPSPSSSSSSDEERRSQLARALQEAAAPAFLAAEQREKEKEKEKEEQKKEEKEKEDEEEENKEEKEKEGEKEKEKDEEEQQEQAVTPENEEEGKVTSADEKQRKRRPGEKFRDEYKPSTFMIEHVELLFELGEEYTRVENNMTMWRVHGMPASDLELDGEDLELQALEVNGKVLKKMKTGEEGEETPEETAKQQQGEEGDAGFELLRNGNLLIKKSVLPEKDDVPFVLKTEVKIHPRDNLKLRGLYVSKKTLVTQCEAEGFRRITYYLDRPDVLARWLVRLEADEEKYPVLLSNGNKIAGGPIPDSTGRHFAVYEDPYLKPSYLFAILAGELGSISGSYVTKSGKDVKITMYSEKRSAPKLRWALDSVKKAMHWDEEEFGREYDLSEFNVGCVSDFNAGAMENKGLNIFNCSLLLADSTTTTDAEFERVMAVVGHEYFHNWTGNRVTLRQLTLKEGLTVFREQQFMTALANPTVQRIQYVLKVVNGQFAEDDSPMAHPIRPESYVSMDNFYTTTVYDKGAEVVRMLYTILGKERFRKGMDRFFAHHDGEAATCDDFRHDMEDANGINLSQFDRWYSQAGTPRLEVVKSQFHREAQVFEISFKQHTPPTPGQPKKEPQMIPIKIGLVGKTNMRDLLNPPTMVLQMTKSSETFKIQNVKQDCVPSILRDFSAPVKLIYPQQSTQELAFLMAYDTDPVNRWQASQTLTSRIILARAKIAEQHEKPTFMALPKEYVFSLREVLRHDKLDNALKAQTLVLPEWDVLARELKPINPDALHWAIRSVTLDVGEAVKTEMIRLYFKLKPSTPEGDQILTQEAVSNRRLRNTLLHFLSEERDMHSAEMAYEHIQNATGMTDKYAALVILANMPHQEREMAFARFYANAVGDELLLDKWFRAQAGSDLPDQVERVNVLARHPAFSYTNPNRLRSLVFAFAANNKKHFHRIDGKGYQFLSDALLKVDKFNPVLASRGAKLFMSWRDYDEKRQELMKNQLKRMLSAPGLSANVREVVANALGEKDDHAVD
ncbi:hypothetical protein Efla_007597 [Eimeria flavescens]